MYIAVFRFDMLPSEYIQEKKKKKKKKDVAIKDLKTSGFPSDEKGEETDASVASQ